MFLKVFTSLLRSTLSCIPFYFHDSASLSCPNEKIAESQLGTLEDFSLKTKKTTKWLPYIVENSNFTHIFASNVLKDTILVSRCLGD